jgi:hypothetical protein
LSKTSKSFQLETIFFTTYLINLHNSFLLYRYLLSEHRFEVSTNQPTPSWLQHIHNAHTFRLDHFETLLQ